MGGSLSIRRRRRKRNGYLEQYPPPPPLLHSYNTPKPHPSTSNNVPPSSPPPPLPHNSMLSHVHNHDLNGHHPSYSSKSSQRHDINVNVGQPPARKDALMNDVGLHKHSIQLNLDPNNPNHHLISFMFDASYDGRIRIIYLAKEEQDCRFTSIFPQASEPIAFPFQRGLGQKFCQPSGTGIDLGLFELDNLSNPSPGGEVFPLVLCAETDPLVEDASPNMQITQAVLDKSIDATSTFKVKVVRQIVWIDQLRYELSEVYGSGNSVPTDFDCNDPGKDCVICLIEPRETVVLPCLHLSMCSECAKASWFRSNKCPICHQPIKRLMEITR